MRASTLRRLGIAALLLAASCGTVTSSGGTGGANGTGGQGGSAGCAKIQSDYQAALTAARACSPAATNQCQKKVSNALGCNGCPTFVNDDSNLGQFSNEWSQGNCDQTQACTNLACASPKLAICEVNDAGGALCVDGLVATP
ncbi:MAG TPA: hypothetical protein VGP64_08535 [Polyangia bacterium]|jgi:hypothetical protein